MRKLFVLVLVGFAIIAGQASAATIDQANTFLNAEFNADWGGFNWQQQVTVGLAGQLVGFDLYPTSWDNKTYSGEVDVYLNVGPAWQSDANDFESILTLPNIWAWNYIDVSSAALNFNVGDQFVIGIKAINNSGTGLGGSYGTTYPGGPLYYNEGIFLDRSLAFRTYVEEAAPVPEPTSLLLLGAGLGAIGLVGRRRKN